ncbi:glycoside hydrolase family 6 protein [Sphaerobolus stellatus SS14]|uniref:Unplaced genomic scaffold SPHSTscaffold_116, whole genome shotgun sequence n=1 Tax=Sphaerobolus stellatus (strain SS14) TaxID=990650 RepID=A0A0C9VCA3_SPHS4|nr:glycoside hydrolase family 6 protein [Sphaerobolus stellatus SS14]
MAHAVLELGISPCISSRVNPFDTLLTSVPIRRAQPLLTYKEFVAYAIANLRSVSESLSSCPIVWPGLEDVEFSDFTVRDLATDVSHYNLLREPEPEEPAQAPNPNYDEKLYINVIASILTQNRFPAHFIVDQVGLGMRPTINTGNTLIDAPIEVHLLCPTICTTLGRLDVALHDEETSDVVHLLRGIYPASITHLFVTVLGSVPSACIAPIVDCIIADYPSLIHLYLAVEHNIAIPDILQRGRWPDLTQITLEPYGSLFDPTMPTLDAPRRAAIIMADFLRRHTKLESF